jgi:hypothetical protein
MSYGPADGDFARCAAAVDRLEREEQRIERMQRWERCRERSDARQAALAEAKVFRDRLDAIDRTMAEYFRRIGNTVETMLIDVGFHRHARGQWRRRRKPMLAIDADRYPEGAVPLTQNETLAKRARGGDPEALETVLKEADRHHHETVEAVLLQSLSIGGCPPYSDPTDFVSIKLCKMRYELAPPGSSRA